MTFKIRNKNNRKKKRRLITKKEGKNFNALGLTRVCLEGTVNCWHFPFPVSRVPAPGGMHLHPGAQDPVRSSERRPGAHSPPILGPPRSPFRRLLPWCSRPSPASPGRSASPRPGLPAASASLPLPSVGAHLATPRPRAPRSDAGRAAGCGRRTSPRAFRGKPAASASRGAPGPAESEFTVFGKIPR